MTSVLSSSSWKSATVDGTIRLVLGSFARNLWQLPASRLRPSSSIVGLNDLVMACILQVHFNTERQLPRGRHGRNEIRVDALMISLPDDAEIVGIEIKPQPL